MLIVLLNIGTMALQWSISSLSSEPLRAKPSGSFTLIGDGWFNYVGIHDQDDRVVLSKRLPNELGVVLECVEAYKADLAGIAVESTYNWYGLVDGLMDQGYRVLLANPAGNEQYKGLKYTDDRYDSRWLAGMVRLGILKTGPSDA